MRGAFSIRNIEWMDWEGPSELTICLTEGADLPERELVEGLKDMLEERHGQKVFTMVVMLQNGDEIVRLANLTFIRRMAVTE